MICFRWLAVVVCSLASTLPAIAGVHYSGEVFAELPSRPSGFLVDHRALRAAGYERPDGLPSPLRDDYLAAAVRLEKHTKTRALSADERADLGAVYIRLGKPDKAVNLLAPAARKFPEHFRIAANLGTAFQLIGDLERASSFLEEAVRLAPAKWKPFEQAHLKLVQLRLKDPRPAKGGPTSVDDLFGVKYIGESGEAEAGKLAAAQSKKLPADAVALIQQLALWLPADARLLWQLGELFNAHADVRSAAACLDGCVTEFALASPALRKRRQLYRSAADELAKKPDHEKHRGTLKVKSARPLVKAFDESLLPAIQNDKPNVLPWPVLSATSVNAKGQPTFAKYLEQLDGKTVTLTGFMQPVKDELAFSAFLLLEYPVGCWFCETPDPTGLISVELKAGITAEFRKGLVKVTGRLVLNRDDPESYLFQLKDARIGEAD
ncbi:MAG: tetratricopeptide repeat protein [Planctomycetia bacterium]|nr:tetratricopeptide repeat protein [Planctomycetia bacterium]